MHTCVVLGMHLQVCVDLYHLILLWSFHSVSQ